jgi:hypothetical protein
MASATLLVRSNSVPTCPAVGIIWIPATIRRHVFKGCAVVGVIRLIIAGSVIVVRPDRARPVLWRVIGSRVSIIIKSCVSVIRSREVRSYVSVIRSRVSVIIESCVSVIGSRVSVIIESCVSVIRSRVVRSCVSVIRSRVSVIIESCVSVIVVWTRAEHRRGRPRRIYRTVGHCLGASLGGAHTGYTGSERD